MLVEMQNSRTEFEYVHVKCKTIEFYGNNINFD